MGPNAFANKQQTTNFYMSGEPTILQPEDIRRLLPAPSHALPTPFPPTLLVDVGGRARGPEEHQARIRLWRRQRGGELCSPGRHHGGLALERWFRNASVFLAGCASSEPNHGCHGFGNGAFTANASAWV